MYHFPHFHAIKKQNTAVFIEYIVYNEFLFVNLNESQRAQFSGSHVLHSLIAKDFSL